MEEWLLLNRINMDCARFTIGHRVELALFRLPNTTGADLTLIEDAIPWTELVRMILTKRLRKW